MTDHRGDDGTVRPVEPEVFRYPDAGEFERWSARQWRTFRGVCVGAPVFAIVWLVVVKYLVPSVPLIPVACGWVLVLGVLMGATFVSTRRIVRATGQVAGSTIWIDEGKVRHISPSGEVLATIDLARPVEMDQVIRGVQWHIVVKQGENAMSITHALPDGDRLCREVLRIDDPRCAS